MASASTTDAAPTPRAGEPAPGPGVRVAVSRLRRAGPTLIAATHERSNGVVSGLAHRALAAREALWNPVERDAVVRYRVDLANDHIGGVLETLAQARNALAGAPSDMRGFRSALQRTRASVASAGVESHLAAHELQQVVSRSRLGGVRTALRELRQAGEGARRWEGELRVVEGRTGLLAELDGATASSAEARGGQTDGSLPTTRGTDAPAAPSIETAPLPAGSEADSVFTEEDLARLGSALDPTRPPPQTLWNENQVNLVSVEGRRQGGITEEEGGRNAALARAALAETPGGAPVEMAAADLAAILKQSGMDLARVDPNQVVAATRYLNTATHLADQQEKLRKVLDNFQTLDRIGLPRMPREQLMGQLWTHGRIEGKVTAHLSEAELRAKFNEIAATLNGGGELQTKIGKYNVRLSVSAEGRVLESKADKPGFWSRVGGFFKKAMPVALTALSFIPVTAPFARIAQGAISLVRSIRAGSVLGAVTSAAGVVAGGASALAARASGAAANAAARVASLAHSAARGLQGYSAVRQGSVLSGLANLGGAVASGIGAFADRVSGGLADFQARLAQTSDRLLKGATGLGAVRSYQRAQQAVDDARQALRAAEASGDAQAIAEARSRLDAAERHSRAALLGGLGTAGLLAADVTGGRRTPGAGEPIDRGPAASPLEATLRAAGRSLSGAGDAVRRDWEAFGASALGLAAAVQSGTQSRGPEPDDRVRQRVDTLIGLGPRVSTLNDASNLADAAVSHRQAERALRMAHASGDPDAIAAARTTLDHVRREREGTLMGAIGAGDSLLGTAEGIGEQRRQARAFEVAREGAVRTLREADALAEHAAAAGWGLPSELKAETNRLSVRLDDARLGYEERLRRANGDPQAIEAATWSFISDQTKVWAGLSAVEELAERYAPRIVPASVTSTDTPDIREGARALLQVGRAAIAEALEEAERARLMATAGQAIVVPESPVEEAARVYAAALDNLEALERGGGGPVALHEAEMKALLAQRIFEAAHNPDRTASDPPPWVVGVGTFIQEFGSRALAIVSVGGTAEIGQALEEGRLDARSGPLDFLQSYGEGIINGIVQSATFGGADDYVEARAGEGRSHLSSMGAGLGGALLETTAADQLRTLADPHANPWERAEAAAIVTATLAGLFAVGMARRSPSRSPSSGPQTRTTPAEAAPRRPSTPAANDRTSAGTSTSNISAAQSDPAARRVRPRKRTLEEIEASASKTETGDFIDPNTGQMVPSDGPRDLGHKPGYEWRRTRDRARSEGWTRRDVIEHENNPDIFQIEDPSSNRSHKFEKKD